MYDFATDILPVDLLSSNTQIGILWRRLDNSIVCAEILTVPLISIGTNSTGPSNLVVIPN